MRSNFKRWLFLPLLLLTLTFSASVQAAAGDHTYYGKNQEIAVKLNTSYTVRNAINWRGLYGDLGIQLTFTVDTKGYIKVTGVDYYIPREWFPNKYEKTGKKILTNSSARVDYKASVGAPIGDIITDYPYVVGGLSVKKGTLNISKKSATVIFSSTLVF